jgi:hypothetical protein
MDRPGYINLERRALHHPVFYRKAYCEFEAWVWLLNDASWKPRQRRIGRYVVDLDRGQLTASIRHLAVEWKWKPSKVVRFLAKLENETMIETRADDGISVITICNYNAYQGGNDSEKTQIGTDTDAVSEQPRNAGDTVAEQPRNNTEEGKQENRETGKHDQESGGGLFGGELVVAKPVGTEFDGMFREWYGAYPKKVDPKDALKSFVKVLKAKQATFDQLLAGARRYAAETSGTDKKYIKAPAVWLNKGSWLNEPMAAGSPPQRSARVSSAHQGIASRLRETDFDD